MSWIQPRIVQTLFVAVVLHRLWVVVYNAFFHPLASFPGPPLAKVTNLWRAYHELYGKDNFTTVKLVELHARYGASLASSVHGLPRRCSMFSYQCAGDVVRVAPNEVRFSVTFGHKKH